ncbi:MAG: ABC transporter ATP-binding protein [Parcubacteria group bacterium]|nr:ABC transporter ATP-binding protein [Parcubacteria group bacterium]
MTEAVRVRNLVKRYKKTKINAVNDISFSVAEGAFFALLGPNGAGKTTTISILTTTLTKTSGVVEIAGFDAERAAGEVRRRIGVIFQTPSLDKNLTAEENIRFHAALYGLFPFRPIYALMPKTYKTRVASLAELLGIRENIFQPIHTFSGGMKRKLEIIRGLMHRPRVLFLDEPTTGLDPISRKGVWNYLQEVRKEERTTIFLTTHYLEEAEDADNICIINRGKIVASGTPENIRKTLVNTYLQMDAKDRHKLVTELARLKLQPEGNGPFRILLQNGIHPQKIIRSIRTPLTLLNIHLPTLEEAYIEIIGEHHADA